MQSTLKRGLHAPETIALQAFGPLLVAVLVQLESRVEYGVDYRCYQCTSQVTGSRISLRSSTGSRVVCVLVS